ncbi:hypothetical protein PVK06_030174 [Gossypium arboreum]|uniref:Uncharacterized protein n=1 Tax=Gossypium arboreum TaxID=29729 RepID=A0ABR0NNN3_GOSAR|nr:hypothetical protein PVK06_030174 [Gossypium arboreum]
MARTRGSAKKATKFVEEHSSSTTVVLEPESSMPTEKNELMIFLMKATKDRFQENINFHPEQGILLSQHQDLGKQASTNSTTVTLNGVCLLYSIVKGREIDIGAIHHQEINDCTARQTGILVFPSLCSHRSFEIMNSHLRMITRDKSVASPPTVHVSIDEKEEILRDIEKCMQRIDSLAEGDFITGLTEPAVEEEVAVEEEEVLVVNVNEKGKEEDVEKESAQNIVTILEFVGATTNNLERDGARLAEAVEEATNDVGKKSELEE